MNESFGERPRSASSMRERELELEIAHLKAELEAARGEDVAETAARLLAMAANTVDAAMEDARQEADALAAEISADAEARRDEAARLAAEAEARTAVLRNEAENHEAVLLAAEEAAMRIKEEAEQEATTLIAAERTRVAEEIEALSAVREALEEERGSLESYHEELRRRVQELAESMVAFMTTEPPITAGSAIDELMPSSIDDQEMAEEPMAEEPMAEEQVMVAAEEQVMVATEEPAAEEPMVAMEAPAVDAWLEPPAPAPAPPTPPAAGIPSTDPMAETNQIPVVDTFGDIPVVDQAMPEPAPVMPEDPSTFGRILDIEHAAGPDGTEAVQAEMSSQAPTVAETSDAVDPGAPETNDGVLGLFSRATPAEIEPRARGSLFGTHGARLVEQTSPEQLEAALAEDGPEDERFETFFAGDDDADPSRDWLLRPEQP